MRPTLPIPVRPIRTEYARMKPECSAETESIALQRQLRDRDAALLRLVFGGWALLGWLAFVILG